jgi:hypothetical protein
MEPSQRDVTAVVIAETTNCLTSCVAKIRHCLSQLTDEQVWWRPHESMNSIGNLILSISEVPDEILRRAPHWQAGQEERHRCHGPTPESHDLQDYLESSEIIDWHTPDIRLLADVLVAGSRSDVDKANRLYEWVRDEIPHSADAGHEIVTCRASEVLLHRTGICYAKAHLLAAVLRAARIPAGLCYQVLRYDASSERLVVHGPNGIYLESLDRWIRVDARGNKPGVNAQFCLDREQLAFPVDPTLGEFTSETIFARPLSNIVACLTSHDTVTELMANLPGNLERRRQSSMEGA